MTTHNTFSRALAILAGTAATIGALAILCGDALESGHWTLEHGLLPVIVSVTILSGHLVGQALRGFKLGSAAGFALLFVIGTGLTVYTSVGRQAKIADTEKLEVTHRNAELERLAAAAADLKQTLAYAVPDMKAECLDAPKVLPPKGWPECRRKRASVEAFQEKLAKTEDSISRSGAPKPVAAKADRAAEVVSLLFAVEKARAKDVFYTFEPFANSLFLELAAIVAFGFGFSGQRRRRERVEITPTPGPVIVAEPAKAEPVKVAHPDRRATVHSFVAAHAAKTGRAPQLKDVQALHFQRFGVVLPKTTAWNWRKEAMESLTPVRHLRVVGG
jgi:hypothetical protein